MKYSGANSGNRRNIVQINDFLLFFCVTVIRVEKYLLFYDILIFNLLNTNTDLTIYKIFYVPSNCFISFYLRWRLLCVGNMATNDYSKAVITNLIFRYQPRQIVCLSSPKYFTFNKILLMR